MEHVRKAFDAVASRYDRQRKFIIPGIDDFYEAAVWAADWPSPDPSILDIGAGTGLLSALLLTRYPRASLALLDFSLPMLEVARGRFARHPGVHFLVLDYSREDLPGKYDIVCSALSIHHLEDIAKERLFQRIYRALNPGGVFVNADQVAAESGWLERKNLAWWDAFLARAPIESDEVKAAIARRDTLDRNARLSDQVGWLKGAGFADVDIVYKNRTFCVFVGRRPAEDPLSK
ncbi:MAG: class I SAM-dependent methyltransferase [Methanolinea sp.]|nr:class I SAM-dependent methyltransferase [Methanolinea sp.]